MKRSTTMHRGQRAAAAAGAGSAAARHGQAGFTLMELLMSALIAGALLSIALPPVLSLMQSSRVASRVNGLLADLRYARRQAVQRGLPVSVCASADGLACTPGPDWQTGWLVFVDADGNGRRGAGEAVLRVEGGGSRQDSFVADDGVTAISYGRNGFAFGLKAGPATLRLHTRPANPAANRCVTVNLAGHSSVQQPGVGDCS